jgi:hypothetical protein
VVVTRYNPRTSKKAAGGQVRRPTMTAQISDVVFYRDNPFSLAGVNGSGLFDQAEHGVRPAMISTACWRGYHCTYEVADGSLLLTKVNIGLAEEDRLAAERGEGPILFGRIPKRYTVEGHRTDLGTGEVTTSWQSSDFAVDSLREPVPFTGGLLLGDGFIEELYVHMGFHPAWKFRQVHELVFEKGRVVKEADRSAEMAGFREMIAGRSLGPRDPDNREEIERWIKRCFSLEYKW